ncbi:MAG: RT0821/Lpp0805 family surface protein [Kiloniellales bacterium]
MTARIEEERLVAYVDGELDAAAARAVEAAMAADPKLTATIAALRAEVALIRAAYQEPLRAEVPKRLVAAVDAAFAERQAGRSGPAGGARWAPGRSWIRHPAFGAIAASIVAVVVGLAGANYFAERGVERELARLEALRAADQEMIEAAISVALEKHVSGQPARWHNPDSGSKGSVEPLRTFKISTGQWCREYAHAIDLRGWKERQATLRAIACREAGGRWKTRLQLGEES